MVHGRRDYHKHGMFIITILSNALLRLLYFISLIETCLWILLTLLKFLMRSFACVFQGDGGFDNWQYRGRTLNV